MKLTLTHISGSTVKLIVDFEKAVSLAKKEIFANLGDWDVNLNNTDMEILQAFLKFVAAHILHLSAWLPEKKIIEDFRTLYQIDLWDEDSGIVLEYYESLLIYADQFVVEVNENQGEQ